MFVLKCLVTPVLIVVATLITRRWGPVVGGVFASLPLMSAPISVFFALEQGTTFAALSAGTSLLGYVAVAVYCLVYKQTLRSLGWCAAALCGSVAFFLAAFFLRMVAGNVLVAAVVAGSLLLFSIRLLGAPPARCTGILSPWWDLPVRMVSAGGMVVLVTGLAQMLGPEWSGFFSTFPVFTSLMLIFSWVLGGQSEVLLMTRGVLVGMFGSVGFFTTVALTLVPLGIVPAYSLGALSNVLVNGAVWFILKKRQPLPEQE